MEVPVDGGKGEGAEGKTNNHQRRYWVLRDSISTVVSVDQTGGRWREEEECEQTRGEIIDITILP